MTTPRSLYILIVLFCVSSINTYAQEELSLDDCIKIALKNNYQIKRAENSALIAKSNRVQALLEYLPNLNAAINYRIDIGPTFDNNTGTFVNRTTRRSNPGIASTFIIFNGLRNTYQYKRTQNQEESSQFALESAKIDTESGVLAAYLNVVLDRERIKIANERVKLLSEQLNREVKRESVGVGNLESVYNFKSQLANENLNLVNLTNTLKADKLRLIQLLSLKEDRDYEIKQYELEENEFLVKVDPFESVLNSALGYSPQLKSARSDFKVSKFRLKEVGSGYSPTFSVSAGIGSLFSSNNTFIDSNGEEQVESFSNQLRQNEGEFINFNLDIPIFNKFRTRRDVQVARLNLANAEYTQNEAEQAVRNNIQQVYLDLVSAQETYKASLENLNSLNQSFQFVKKRYDTGNTDFYTYLESLNNKNRAEIELANAKYSIIFRKKILNLLQGV